MESLHRVSVAVVDDKGDLILSAGDTGIRTYFRSSAKLLQAIPLLEAGGRKAFGFTAREVAVMAASHDGEKIHTETVFSILSKIGLEEKQLFCGPHEPYHLPASIELRNEGRIPTSVHNNCSGKHSGMLAMCVLKGWEVDGYQKADHPVQKRIFDVVAEAVSQAPSEMEYGVDGCGVPTFYLSVHQMALAYSRLAIWSKTEDNRGNAVNELLEAVREAPVMIEGTGGFCSELIRATGGRIIGKVGGEGIFCITVPDDGLGIALKVEDGNRRAISPAVVELLKTMKLVGSDEVDRLAPYHTPTITNHQGDEVGRITPEMVLDR